MNKRETWLDIAKGIGILSVVISHGGNPVAHQYLFWFHMPLFFIISGYLFRRLDTYDAFIHWTKKRTIQLLVPYVSFGLAISLFLFFTDLSMTKLIENIQNLAYGGQVLRSFFAVFWFITCLYLTQILFALMQLVTKNMYIHLGILTVFYYAAHVIGYSPKLENVDIPWNADVALLAIVYYAFGYYGKRFLNALVRHKQTLLISVLLATAAIALQWNHIIHFELDMKLNKYSSMGLNLLIPLIFSLLVFTVSYQFSLLEKKFWEYLGTASLTIMYLHIPLNKYLQDVLGDYNLLVYTLVGVLIPLTVHYAILVNFDFTKKAFLGVFQKKTYQRRRKVAS
ncbi:acyltransferase family protein [Bacillus thermotolerans]|uniref:acyltransferase family protein n=1 Tax=Bacillus thermotolerans TaxID=1221996 RepID=UPI0005892D4C|nr:acyltransferase family protein [Bacillus thermotolerans]KKB44101.1 Glycosyltransferase [Bacillus thermotolerans]